VESPFSADSTSLSFESSAESFSSVVPFSLGFSSSPFSEALESSSTTSTFFSTSFFSGVPTVGVSLQREW
jgi:hypothetical protein